MRTAKALKNIYSQISNILIISILNLFYRAVLIDSIGIDYVGLNAALLNVVVLLSITELGVWQSVSFFLYNPLKVRDFKRVHAILLFLKKIYIYIGAINIIIALLMIYFIGDIINLNNDVIESKIVLFFILYAASSIIPYFFSYKRVLIIADQKNYKILPIITAIKVVDIFLKVYVLFSFKSYLFVLIIQVIFILIENIIVNKFIDKEYDYLFNNINDYKLTGEDKVDIKRKIKSMFFHKFGDLSLNSTDNIIINHFVGLAILGIYSNYVMLIGFITTFISVAFNSITSSVGNLMTEKNKESKNIFFGFIYKLSVFLFVYSSIYFYFLSDYVVYIWLGDKYFIDDEVKLLMSVSLILLGIRIPFNIIKVASGEVDKDKFAPLVQACINLVLSICLASYFGIKGVLLGTIISNILVPIWVQPYIVYKYVLDESIIQYFYVLLKIIFLSIISFILVYILYDEIYTQIFEKTLDTLLGMVYFILIVMLPSFLFMIILFFTKNDFSYIRKRISI